ncbi:SEC-C domain-containing protein [Chryseobacterium kwangjuense]|uniref:SEC-C domain-containing protein n=1 Tax=Chryseobacterium kwangjuense TaxID=267125 RepID=A0A135W9L6_9FLAO|nr:SEC-C domain-containing protein [Chryseobacterium kwangjuense]KXH81618.1 hypothetical protein AU378_18175 [Chryseobacterium kwangjuense]
MQQAINLTLNRNFKIRNFEEDKAAIISANPGLKYLGVVEGFHKFDGNFYLKNDEGELIESFNIVIVVNHKKYPNSFPLLLLIDDKIEKSLDNHLSKDGLVCLEHTYSLNKIESGGIRVYDFINHYLTKYFSWVLVKKYGRSEILDEYQHHEKGTIQFYQELLKTMDKKIIYQFLEEYCHQIKTKQNSMCYCGSGKKLKKCHYEAVIMLKATSKKIILSDLKLFL